MSGASRHSFSKKFLMVKEKSYKYMTNCNNSIQEYKENDLMFYNLFAISKVLNKFFQLSKFQKLFEE